MLQLSASARMETELDIPKLIEQFFQQLMQPAKLSQTGKPSDFQFGLVFATLSATSVDPGSNPTLDSCSNPFLDSSLNPTLVSCYNHHFPLPGQSLNFCASSCVSEECLVLWSMHAH